VVTRGETSPLPGHGRFKRGGKNKKHRQYALAGRERNRLISVGEVPPSFDNRDRAAKNAEVKVEERNDRN